MLFQPWAKPIIRIGDAIYDERPMGQQGTKLDIVSDTTGKVIYFYVNGAVVGVPRIWDWFYRGYSGTATLRITCIERREVLFERGC
jgi:hypothetical protein